MKILPCCFLIFLALVVSTELQAGTLIRDVELGAGPAPDKAAIQKSTSTADNTPAPASVITWRLARAGRLSMFICDLQGYVVRTFFNREELPAGDHTVTWDGQDDAGAACPAGLYFPVIRIKTADRGVETYNPTALPWGEELVPEDVDFDDAGKVIRYTLQQKALVRIRVGERNGGPLYKTVSDWKLLPPGSYEAPWDGRDVTGLVDVASNPGLLIAVDAFTVPENSILLVSPAGRSGKSAGKHKDKHYRNFPVYPPHGKRVSYIALLPHGLLPDPAIRGRFGKGVAGKGGVYPLHGTVPVFLDLVRGKLGIDPPETIERYLFVDGRMVQEGPTDALPAKVSLDTTRFANGRHIVTLVLRTSDDRAASFSMPVAISN